MDSEASVLCLQPSNPASAFGARSDCPDREQATALKSAVRTKSTVAEGLRRILLAGPFHLSGLEP